MTNMPDQPVTSATPTPSASFEAPVDSPIINEQPPQTDARNAIIDDVLEKSAALAEAYRKAKEADPKLFEEMAEDAKRDKELEMSAWRQQLRLAPQPSLEERRAKLEKDAAKEATRFAVALVGKLVGEFVLPVNDILRDSDELDIDTFSFAVHLVAEQLAAAVADEKFNATFALLELPAA